MLQPQVAFEELWRKESYEVKFSVEGLHLTTVLVPPQQTGSVKSWLKMSGHERFLALRLLLP